MPQAPRPRHYNMNLYKYEPSIDNKRYPLGYFKMYGDHRIRGLLKKNNEKHTLREQRERRRIECHKIFIRGKVI